jgi:ornithine cyclodeaminase
MQVVTADDLRRLVPMRDAVEVVREAFERLSEGQCDQPPRVTTADGAALAMLASVLGTESPASGTVFKVVSVCSENRERDLPTVHAVVVWFDGVTHRPRLLVEGSSLTALRTGAASGAATDILAAPDASTLAVLGAGGQALDQIRGVAAVRPVRDVRIFSPSGDSARRLAAAVATEFPGLTVLATRTAFEAVEGAQVICCATNSSTPVVSPEWIRGRTHINAIGSYRAEMKELPRDTIAQAEYLAVDHLSAAKAEAGELIDAVAARVVSWDNVVEIGDLAARPGIRPDGITVFKSVGVAIQDWAICNLLDSRLASGSNSKPLELGRTDQPALA